MSRGTSIGLATLIKSSAKPSLEPAVSRPDDNRPFCLFIWYVQATDDDHILSLTVLRHKSFGKPSLFSVDVTSHLDNQSSTTSTTSTTTSAFTSPHRPLSLKQAFQQFERFIEAESDSRCPLLLSENKEKHLSILKRNLKNESVNIPSWYFSSIPDLATDLNLSDEELTPEKLAHRFHMSQPTSNSSLIYRVSWLSEIIASLQEDLEEQDNLSDKQDLQDLLWKHCTPFLTPVEYAKSKNISFSFKTLLKPLSFLNKKVEYEKYESNSVYSRSSIEKNISDSSTNKSNVVKDEHRSSSHDLPNTASQRTSHSNETAESTNDFTTATDGHTFGNFSASMKRSLLSPSSTTENSPQTPSDQISHTVEYYTIDTGTVFHQDLNCKGLQDSLQPRRTHLSPKSIPVGRTPCGFCMQSVCVSYDTGYVICNAADEDDGSYFYVIPTGYAYHTYLDCEGLQRSTKTRTRHLSLSTIPQDRCFCKYCSSRKDEAPNYQNTPTKIDDIARNLYQLNAYNETHSNVITGGPVYYTISSGEVNHVTPNCKGLRNTHRPLSSHTSLQEVPRGRRPCGVCC